MGTPPQAGAALQALAVPGQHFGAPLLDAARRSTFELGASRLVSAGRGSTSGSGRCPSAFRGPPPRCCQAQHFRASRLVSAGRGSLQALDISTLTDTALADSLRRTSTRARFVGTNPHTHAARRSTFEHSLARTGRGSTSGSGRCPSAFRGPPPRCCQAQHFRASEPRGSFLLAGAALQALDGARARFGAPPLDAARRSTFEPRARFGVSAGRGSTSGSRTFLLAGAALWSLWTVPERVSGPPPSMLPGAALSSLGASRQGRFCWQGQPPRCCQAQHFRATRTRTHTPITRTHISTLTDTHSQTHSDALDTHTYVDTNRTHSHAHTYLC